MARLKTKGFSGPTRRAIERLNEEKKKASRSTGTKKTSSSSAGKKRAAPKRGPTITAPNKKNKRKSYGMRINEPAIKRK